jgi:hypothetical protein
MMGTEQDIANYILAQYRTQYHGRERPNIVIEYQEGKIPNWVARAEPPLKDISDRRKFAYALADANKKYQYLSSSST